MFHRRLISVLVSVGLGFLLTGCGTASLRSIQIVPAPGTQVLNSPGEQAQFRATGTFQRGNHPATTQDITAQATWSSSDTSVATINSAGMATAGLTQGTTIITASLSGALGNVTGASDLAVSGSGSGPGQSGTPSLASISIIPGGQTVQTMGETGQFIAIGTYSGGTGPTTQDLTNIVTWKSSDVTVATIDASGLATGVNPGTTTITAIGTSASGAVVTASSTFTEQAPGGGVNLPTLTVYKVGKGSGTVTANDPGTGRPVINCGSGTGCVGNFTLNANVVLFATPDPSSTFVGWSANCTAVAGNPTHCTVTMSNNDTVGALFD